MTNAEWLPIVGGSLAALVLLALFLMVLDLCGVLPASQHERRDRRERAAWAAQVGMLQARHQPGQTPQNVHFAPHITAAPSPPLPALPGVEAAPALVEAALPGPCTLSDLMRQGFTPRPDAILLGQAAGGELITVPVGEDLCHVLITGSTSNGKSSLFRLLMAQLLYVGVPVFWLDPHYADFDNRGRADWRPLAARFTGGPLMDEDRITQALAYLVGPEMERRKLARQRTGDPGPPIFVGTDEWATQVDAQSGLARHLAKFVREARKFNEFLGIASQGATVATLGINGDVRQQFLTVYDVGGNRRVRPEILGLPMTSPEPGGRGRVYLKSPLTNNTGRLVRVPWVDNPALYDLLGAPDGPPPWGWDAPRRWPGATIVDVEATVAPEVTPPPPFLQPDPPPAPAPSASAHPSPVEVDPRAARIAELLQQGIGPAGIVKEVWGVSGGRAYTAAAAELTAIFAAWAAEATARREAGE